MFLVRFFVLVSVLILSLNTLVANEVNESLFVPLEKSSDISKLSVNTKKELVKQSRFTLLNTKLLGGQGDTYDKMSQKIILELFDKQLFVAILDKMENISLGGYAWIGRVEGEDFSQVIFAVKNGIVTGKISTLKSVYEIKNVKDDIYVIEELDHTKFPPELEPISPPKNTLDNISFNAPTANSCTDITIMVVYTTEAKNAAGGTSQIESLINLAITETNRSYENSGLVQRIRLVHTMETNEADNMFSADLYALQDTTDGKLDAVDNARDTYGADLVAMVIENSSSCGLGYLNSNAAYAFSVSHRTCTTGYYSFGHELGHNMGARHDWYVDDTNTAAHGFVNVDDNWRTIMAYNTLCSDNSEYCTRLQYWSNPNVSYGSDPMGVSSSGPSNCVEDSLSPNPSSCKSDNREKLNSTCAYVAGFRSSGALIVSDFSGNYSNDLLWHNSTTGAVRIMEMNGMNPEAHISVVDSSNLNLIPKGIGDFNGDGKVDILVHNQNTGMARAWLMNGTTRLENIALLNSSNTNLQVAGVGDFDRDGDNDIAVFNANSGSLIVWVMNGTTKLRNETVVTGANVNLAPKGVGDMNNDGIPDIVLRNSNSGAVRVWTMNNNFTRKGNEYVTGSSNTNLELRGVVDINGDGNSDILNYNIATGKLRSWLMDGSMGILENAEIVQDADLDWSVRN